MIASIVFSILMFIMGTCDLSVDVNITKCQPCIDGGIYIEYEFNVAHNSHGDECYFFWGFEFTFYDENGFEVESSLPVPSGLGASSGYGAGKEGSFYAYSTAYPIYEVRLDGWAWCLRHVIVNDNDVAVVGY